MYLPCILQTKKRYVGFSKESLRQTTPLFDAKGIETVRRDGCPAVAKVLEKSLRILFERRDVSQTKAYFIEQVLKSCSKEEERKWFPKRSGTDNNRIYIYIIFSKRQRNLVLLFLSYLSLSLSLSLFFSS